MADDKKNIPEAAPPAEAPAPTVENAAVPEQPAPEPALTDAETVMLEHEGQAALFEMGEAVPDPADAVTYAEVEEPAASEVPKDEKEQAHPPTPGKDNPAPAHSGKVVDFAAARDEEAKGEKKAVKQKTPTEKDKVAKPGRGRPPKEGRVAPDKAKPPKPRDKKSQSKPVPEKPAVDKGGAPAGTEVTPEPSAPRDATRAEKEEIVYLNLSDLHPFKNHPFGVRDDAEMQGLVESVKAAGVNQPALVRPREDGGYLLTNNNANIRRVRQRIEELSNRSEFVGWTFPGGEAKVNEAENRLQLIFDGKPDADTRQTLKSEGFKWAPSQGAWQRQLNQNAIRAAARLDFLHPEDGKSPYQLQPFAKRAEKDVSR